MLIFLKKELKYEVSDKIYWCDEDLSAEEIVEWALEQKPIILPLPSDE
ncbi:hypothetical protein QTG56_25465 (plasmid) [Rossellomorea sp. AcN35-11]|nr:hypothetical protein [Rossellomorea aquimaris]WJV31965.1 hypothetical protein QTG56_25465 [Rossellomorea sp. AcN35-11]